MAPRRGRSFRHIFPETPPVHRCALCEILSGMKHGLRVVYRLQALVSSPFASSVGTYAAAHQACIRDRARDGKPNDFPNSVIRSGKSAVICRLSRIPRISLTVKFRSRTPRNFLPSDLPSNRFAWGQWMPIDGERQISAFQRVTSGNR